MLSSLHYIALLQQWPDAFDASMGDQTRLLNLVGRLTPEDVQLYYQIALHGRRDLPYAPDPRTGLEMTVLRMLAFRPAGAGMQIEVSVKKVSAATDPPATRGRPLANNPAVALKPEAPVEKASVIAEPVAQPVASKPVSSVLDDWHQLMGRLPTSGVVKQLAMNCSLLGKQAGRWLLALDPNHKHLLTSERQDRLQEDVCEALAQQIKLQIDIQPPPTETPAARLLREVAERQAQAQTAITSDDGVKNLRETFGAQIKPESIQQQET